MNGLVVRRLGEIAKRARWKAPLEPRSSARRLLSLAPLLRAQPASVSPNRDGRCGICSRAAMGQNTTSLATHVALL